jgi:gliding-associated putative ABC transporter substrate-binding component GldG
MRTKTSLLYTLLLVAAIIIVVNILSNRFFVRLDVTEDQRYSLSPATKNILRSLDEPVTVTAYFSENLPPELSNLKRDFKNMLTEFSNISKGMVVYEFIDPSKDETTEQQVQQKGIIQRPIQGREKDQIKFQIVYQGAEVQMGNNSEVISIIQSVQGMEYALTSSIKKLSVQEKPLIGILQGHGETPFNQLGHLLHGLSVLYDVLPVTLTDSTAELNHFEALAVIAPVDSFQAGELAQLDEFLASGKGVFIALNRVDIDLNTEQTGRSINTALETWLAQKGIMVNENFVLDINNVPIGIQQQTMTPFGPGMVTRQIPFPFFPLVNNFADHPITAGLENVFFRFVSSISWAGDSANIFTPIVKTSGKAGTQSAGAWMNFMKDWDENDFPLSNITLAAAIEGPIIGQSISKLVVVADADIFEPVSQRGPNPDNVYLAVNAIDWISDDTGLIELRTKGASSRPISGDLSDGKRAFLKYFNFLFPIILIILVGIVRFQIRRNQRMKRMEVGYV